MFYQEKPDFKTLRFGDVLRGFTSVMTIIDDPLNPNALETNDYEYNIKSTFTRFSVVISPCCNIGEKHLFSIVPLKELNPSYFKYDNFFSERFSRLNSPMKYKDTIPQWVWEKHPEDKKVESEAEGERYQFIALFFYEKNVFLPEYTRNYKSIDYKTSYYVIDFREISSIESKNVVKKQKKVEVGENLAKSKIIELSVETRKVLREKLMYYFGRPAPEDEPFLDH